MPNEFVAYHNHRGSDHQAQFNALYPQGYRIISLSVYQPSSPLYAAVWVKRAGPNWSAVHAIDAAGYQNAYNNAVANGLHPTLITAAGSRANAVFAGVFEQRPGPSPLTRYGLISGSDTDPNSIQYCNKQAHANRWIMTCGALYGDQGSPAFAGIWPPNSNNTSWSADGLVDLPNDYQYRFNAQVAGWARPSYVAVSEPERYLSIFTDDQIGPWIARHAMTSAQYQAEFDRLVPLGFFPICVQAGGSGNGIRFAAVFARQEALLPRQWIVSGMGTAPSVDQAMHDTMVASGVRGASLAVANGTRLVFARGYTNAEPGYPTVLPTRCFALRASRRHLRL